MNKKKNLKENASKNSKKKDPDNKKNSGGHENIITILDILHESQHAAKIGTWWINVSDKSIFWTKETYRIFGYEPDSVVPTLDFIFNHIHPDDIDFVKSVAGKQLKKFKGIMKFEYRIICGEYVKVLEHIGRQKYDKNGNVERVIGTLQDITERKNIENALRESEERQKSIIENSNAGYFFIDNEGIFRNVNPAWLKMHKYEKPEDIIGKHFSITQTKPDLINAERNVADLYAGKNIKGEFSRKCRDGSVGYHTFSARPVKKERKIIGIEGFIIDITEHKFAEEEIRENERLLNAISDNMPNSIVTVIESDYTVGFISGQELIRNNYIPEDFIGSKVDKLMGNTETLMEYYERTFKGEESAFELKVNNTYRLFKTVPLYSEDGTIKRILSVAENIDERKKTEAALQESEEKHRHFLENFDGIAYQTSYPDFKPLLFSGKVREITGYTADQYIKGEISWNDLVHPADIEFMKGEVKKLLNSESHIADNTYRIISRNGEVKWMRDIARIVIKNPGKKKIIQGTVYDITKQIIAEKTAKKNRQLINLLFSTAKEHIIALSRTGEVRFINNTAADFLGGTIEEFKGKKLSDFFPPEFVKNGIDIINRIIETKNGETDEQYFSINGKDIWLYSDIQPVINNSGDVEMILIVSTDLTDKKKAENALLESENKLRHAEKMQAIGQLAGGIAHDFNNQLAGILGFADILHEELDKYPILLRNVDNIINCVARASDLTAQLLAFSRKGKYQNVPVDIHRIIFEVVNLLQHSIDKKISIEQELKANPAATCGDPTQLQNAILNIALNARDAMPSGGIISFKTNIRKLEKDYIESNHWQIVPGSYVHISISDTGTGISVDIKDHIFEPFFTTKEQGEGTGMGLAAVYGTVTGHNGAITFSSSPGNGSIFELFLPLKSDSGIKTEQQKKAEEKMQKSARILLVDDEEIIRNVATDMLKKLGFSVDVCRNGQEAADFYINHYKNIDLVIIDMVMPVMGGKDAFLKLKEINPDVKVLLSSGYSVENEAQDVLKKGAKGFIQKPFRKSELFTIISEILEE